MLPKFIIIGAMKCGTSSLYQYLADHPDTVPSSVKETNFFRDDRHFNKGVDWYKGLFNGDGHVAYEASPDYTKRQIFPGVPARMHGMVPDARLIYVMRDPVERARSHYMHNVAHGRESRPFSEVLEDAGSGYILTSQYYFQLEAYLEFYQPEQILLVQAEQLLAEPARVVNDVCRFLDIAPEIDDAVYARHFNRSAEKRIATWLEKRILRWTKNRLLITAIRKIATPFKKPVSQPVITDSDRERLAELIGADTNRLRAYSGLAFEGWTL